MSETVPSPAPADLDLVARTGPPVSAGVFGATVAPNRKGLVIPPDLYHFLDHYSVYTAAGLVAYARAFPDLLAEVLHVLEQDVVSALPQLIEELARVLPRKVLAEKAEESFGYGARDETQKSEPVLDHDAITKIIKGIKGEQ